MGVFKKIKDDFTAATRRFALLATFAGGTLFFIPAASAQTSSVPVNNGMSKTEQSATTPLTNAQRKAINKALIHQAQVQFADVSASVKDGYSRWLRNLQTELNTRVPQGAPNPKIRIVVLDPIQMDVGLGLGLLPPQAAMLMLKANGVEPSIGLILNAANHLTGQGCISAMNDTSYTQVPYTIFPDQDLNGVSVRIVIPMSDYVPYVSTPGVSPQENLEFVDRHEGWHAIDVKNSTASLNSIKLDTTKLQTITEKFNNPDYLKLSCVSYNAESYADVGASGDMVRKGHSIDAIDSVIAWRVSSNLDAMHMSAPALTELKAQINKMGIANFMKLNDKEARNFYDRVLDRVRLTDTRLSLVYQYVQCKPEGRAAFVVRHIKNQDFAVAFKYINCFLTDKTIDILSVQRTGGFDASRHSLLMQVKNEVMAWDVKTELQNRAMAIDGKITPVSYAKAYGSLMNAYDTLPKQASPYDQILLASKIIRLKNTYFNAVATTDYVQLNADHGVDILKAEPSLQAVIDKNKAPAPIRLTY